MNDITKATKERGVIFNAEMVRAIIEGRKTQTRRVMKIQPVLCGRFYKAYGTEWSEGVKFVPAIPGHSLSANCPLGSVGDRLWVRETFRVHSSTNDFATLVYQASERSSWTGQTRRIPIAACKKPVSLESWIPSIHMPRWASRITLEIIGVRVERLNDISQKDAQEEGMAASHPSVDAVARDLGYPDFPRSAFAQLWQSIYGSGSWLFNPWVWVIEFRALKLAQ